MHKVIPLTPKQRIAELEKQLKQTTFYNRIVITVALIIGFVLGKLS
jgi:hypothetical protein